MEDEDFKDDETNEEKRERVEKLSNKLDLFMQEVGGDLLSTKEKEMTFKKFREVFKGGKIPWTTTHLKAFVEGLQFCMQAYNKDHDDANMNLIFPVFTLFKREVLKKEKELLKSSTEAITNIKSEDVK